MQANYPWTSASSRSADTARQPLPIASDAEWPLPDIRERSPGHWAIVIDVSDPQTGQRKRRWYSFQGTKRAAQSECARLLAAQEAGTAVEPSRLTVAAYLGKWLDHVRPQVSPRTIERYAEIAAEYLAPAWGRCRCRSCSQWRSRLPMTPSEPTGKRAKATSQLGR